MSNIPCRKCSTCGLYHDVSVVSCYMCGTQMNSIPVHIVNTETIPPEQFGEISESVTAYVQKCPSCGTFNYTADKENPVTICFKCYGTAIAGVKCVEFGNYAAVSLNNSNDSVQWENVLRIKAKTSGEEPLLEKNFSSVPSPVKAPPAAPPAPEPVAETDWASILANIPPVRTPGITLTAINYGNFSTRVSITLNESYMLGRSANLSNFLACDGRVGNEHCYLQYKDNAWYVTDNHSSNGTAVNRKDIGYNGKHILRDGDLLTLGHHQDSVTFKITVG